MTEGTSGSESGAAQLRSQGLERCGLCRWSPSCVLSRLAGLRRLLSVYLSGGKPLVACQLCEEVRSVCPALVNRPGGPTPVEEATHGEGGPNRGDCGSTPGAGTLLGTDERQTWRRMGSHRALGAGPAGSGWTPALCPVPPHLCTLVPGEPGARSDGEARDCGEQAPWARAEAACRQGGGHPVPSHDGEQSGHAGLTDGTDTGLWFPAKTSARLFLSFVGVDFTLPWPPPRVALGVLERAQAPPCGQAAVRPAARAL